VVSSGNFFFLTVLRVPSSLLSNFCTAHSSPSFLPSFLPDRRLLLLRALTLVSRQSARDGNTSFLSSVHSGWGAALKGLNNMVPPGIPLIGGGREEEASSAAIRGQDAEALEDKA